MAIMRVSFEWEQIGEVALSASGRPAFPVLPTPDAVGLYRIELTEDGQRRVYIGETGRGLARRWKDYERGAGKSTASRMHVRLLRSLARPAEPVTVSRLVNLRLFVDETPVRPEAVPAPFLRRLVENAALIDEHARGAAIINGDGYAPTVQ
jgi:hypothetical protein